MNSYSFLLLFSILPMLSQAQVGNLRVQGEAVIYATPELLSIQIPISAKHATYAECAAELTKIYNELGMALTKSGIDKKDIKSNGLNIRENYTWTDRERKSDGYIGSLNAQLQIPHTTEMLNAFMKTMSQERFSFGYNLGFELSESQKATMKKEAITKAVQDAEIKAEALASSLKLKVLYIKEVNYVESQGGHDVLMMRENAKMASDMQDIEMNAKEMEIRKTVDIIWAVAP